ncbi:entericidin EcnAB [Sulfurimonas sp.]|jgi:outer membrane biogenesis lipoprotein LolB
MKKIFLLLTIMFLIFLTGCSATVKGVKQDSKKIWEDTKETIHEATE